jgi:hypothetical protein
MTDIIDQGNEAAELFLRSALSPKKLNEPIADGKCHNCEASVPRGARWCDADCRTDWEKFERAQQMRAREEDE